MTMETPRLLLREYTNVGSGSTAVANGMKMVKEYPDSKNTISYVITRKEWEAENRCTKRVC